MSAPTTSNTSVYSVGSSEKVMIEKSINEIKKGSGYFVSNTVTQAAGINFYTYIKALNTAKLYHLTFKSTAYPQVEVTLYEGTGSAVTGSAGTILIPYNMNRVLGSGSLTVVSGVTTGSSGTGSKLFYGYIPDWGVQRFGSSEARQNEIIIDNTKPYILGFSGSAAGRIGYEIYWYEE